MKRGALVTLKIAGGLAATPILLAFDEPVLTASAVVIAIITVALCWAIADAERAARLALLIQVCRNGSQKRDVKRRS
ncbi:hypothetical protein [Actinoallomurus sp. CA-142502]|uniref:hypothetical protein n=1 Tax=Actinoallomurus sp. CA-142502 TaxID=3239885 RepID=UPI003D8E5BE6